MSNRLFQRLLFGVLLLLSIIVFLSLSSCRKYYRDNSPFKDLNIHSKTSPDYTTQGIPDKHYENMSLKKIYPKIAIPKEMPLIETIEVNLDSDDSEEQIILVKENREVNARFTILIADYIQLFEYCTLSSSNLTQATNIQSFQVSLLDVCGDKALEIVCTGINKNDGQTIDIFKYMPASVSSGLKYVNILSLTSTGTIDIIHGKEGEPMAIERQQIDSENQGIIRRDIFIWNPQALEYSPIGQYEYAYTERIQKKQINDLTLKKIIDDPGMGSKLDFLEGQWIQESEKKQKIYLFFDGKSKTFSIYCDNSKHRSESNIENYNDLIIRRAFYNRFNIEGKNEIHTFKITTLKVIFESTDLLKVEVYDNDSSIAKLKPNLERSGTFKRISKEELTQLRSHLFPQRKPLPNINGIYNERLGKQYIFNYPYFKIKKEESEVLNGGYALYHSNVPILEMLTFNERGVVKKREVFKFDYVETQTGRKFFKTITLIPGKMTIHGFVETSKEPIKLENEEFNIDTNDKHEKKD